MAKNVIEFDGVLLRLQHEPVENIRRTHFGLIVVSLRNDYKASFHPDGTFLFTLHGAMFRGTLTPEQDFVARKTLGI